MHSWSFRGLVLAFMVASFASIGCDSNPSGPSAPTGPTAGATTPPPPAPTPGTKPAKSGRAPSGAAPIKAD